MVVSSSPDASGSVVSAHENRKTGSKSSSFFMEFDFQLRYTAGADLPNALTLMEMNTIRCFVILLFAPVIGLAQTSDSLQIRQIYDEVLLHGECHQNLKYLCKKIGARLSGSPQADEAIE